MRVDLSNTRLDFDEMEPEPRQIAARAFADVCYLASGISLMVGVNVCAKESLLGSNSAMNSQWVCQQTGGVVLAVVCSALAFMAGYYASRRACDMETKNIKHIKTA